MLVPFSVELLLNSPQSSDFTLLFSDWSGPLVTLWIIYMVKTNSRGQSIQFIALFSLSHQYRSFDSVSDFLTFCSYLDFTETFYSGLDEVLVFVVYWQNLFCSLLLRCPVALLQQVIQRQQKMLSRLRQLSPHFSCNFLGHKALGLWYWSLCWLISPSHCLWFPEVCFFLKFSISLFKFACFFCEESFFFTLPETFILGLGN